MITSSAPHGKPSGTGFPSDSLSRSSQAHQHNSSGNRKLKECRFPSSATLQQHPLWAAFPAFPSSGPPTLIAAAQVNNTTSSHEMRFPSSAAHLKVSACVRFMPRWLTELPSIFLSEGQRALPLVTHGSPRFSGFKSQYSVTTERLRR